MGAADPATLFAKAASTDPKTKVDWTMCYTDPDDRAYLEKHSGFLVVIGGAYRQAATKRYLIMSNGPFKKVIQQDKHCVFEFLKAFAIEDATLQQQTAQSWLDNHLDLVRKWTHCQ